MRPSWGTSRSRGAGASSCRRDACRSCVAVPELEGQQLPQLLGDVTAPGALVADDAQQLIAAKKSGGGQLATDERVVDELAQVIGDPRPQGRTEGRLGALDDLVGDPRPRGLFQCRLLDATVDLGGPGQLEGRAEDHGV